MKITTQDQMDKVLLALEVLTGFNLADVAKMRARHLEQTGQDPNVVCLPVKDFTLMNMSVHFSTVSVASTLSPVDMGSDFRNTYQEVRHELDQIKK